MFNFEIKKLLSGISKSYKIEKVKTHNNTSFKFYNNGIDGLIKISDKNIDFIHINKSDNFETAILNLISNTFTLSLYNDNGIYYVSCNNKKDVLINYYNNKSLDEIYVKSDTSFYEILEQPVRKFSQYNISPTVIASIEIDNQEVSEYALDLLRDSSIITNIVKSEMNTKKLGK